MAEIVKCPECDRQLRVPDELLGKKVKCPSCSATFTASSAEAGEPLSARDEEPKYEEVPEDDALEQEPRPRRRRRGADDDADDEPRPRRRRRKRLSSRYADHDEAMALVSGPATACMVSGILMCVCSVCSIMSSLTGAGMNAVALRDMGGEVAMLQGGVGAVYYGAILLSAITVIVGSQKMKNLESYGLAMASAIITVIPCTTCILWGLPIGIWALVILAKPEVKDAFS